MTVTTARPRHTTAPATSPSTASAPPTAARRLRVRPVAPPPRGRLAVAPPSAPVPLLRPGIEPRPEPVVLDDTPSERPAPPLGDPTALVCAVVRGTVEALRGERPLTQLARWVTPSIMDALTTRAALVRGVPRPPVAPRPVLVRRARVVRLGPTSAEATVVVDDVDRVRAAALRVEVRRGHWRVVALEIG
ncbi:Rv3235 family protein [Luteimicrobium subarcticum]|uniref:Uncharacterized protein n=1 Tax=Luteimicrobium subarcticum TaxID=620910 RepID=A0A2M8WWB8_9MICO|nr:Rv3235 family protein [Luteimicrobium subarcticum]PJI95211.1 hypothetical protein CLV34_0085 [Luteimicrobium subarcticum]